MSKNSIRISDKPKNDALAW